jgi:predicted aldo/keto reductase-like oxidoreductase
MRFPEGRGDAVRMVRYAIDNGVNYLDSAYVYKDSEVITGEALRDGYRGRVVLATKSPIWNVERHADFERFLDEELRRLGTDYIDMYLLHNMNPGNWEKVRRLDGLGFLDRMVEKGKIRHKGFSIHNTVAAFREIADAFDWEMAQIQLNILGETYQVGLEGLAYGAKRGLGMVIMEPLRGGSIVSNVPDEVGALLEGFPERRSLAEWCFRWLYNMSEVSVILSGTSNLEQLKDNLRIFERSGPGLMSGEEMGLIRSIQDVYEAKMGIGCTGCRYCMPCPQGINIPEVFQLYNQYSLFNKPLGDSIIYRRNMVELGIGADQCAGCGNCKLHCPQQLDIPELMRKVHGELSQGA